MKKTLIIAFALLLAISLVSVASAQGDELKSYVEERIAPILAGVMTSIIALLGTLRGIFSMIKGVKESKDIFENHQKSLKEDNKRFLDQIKDKYEEIKRDTESLPDLRNETNSLKSRIDDLCLEIANLSEMSSCGFSRNEELIRGGKARKIEILAEKNREIAGSDKP